MDEVFCGGGNAGLKCFAEFLLTFGAGAYNFELEGQQAKNLAYFDDLDLTYLLIASGAE